jgi:hypothetical protein
MTTKTSSDKNQAELLREAFPREALRELKKQGTSLTYVPVSEVIARLNNVLGVENWNIVESDAWRDSSNDDWVIAKVTLRAVINGVETTRIGWGGQQIKMKRDGSGPLDLGDEFKGASSDALKKAAQALGVALDLARDEDMLALERELLEEKVSPRQRQFIVDYIDQLSDEEKESVKTWFIDCLPGKSLKRNNITVEDFDLFVESFSLSDTWNSVNGA